MSTSFGSPDIIIVGGGVIGCATAYFLAKEHHLRSLIIERDAIASEASGGAAGELASATRHKFSEGYTTFILDGIRLHRELAQTLQAESGINYGFGQIPVIRPAFSDAEAVKLREEVAWHATLGIKAEWLDADSAQELGTWLAPDALGAAYAMEHQLEAYPFALAVAQAAETHGVEVRTGEVTGLTWDGQKATGVRVGAETVQAGAVVIANGPWSQYTGEWMGLDVPVIPVRGQIVHLAPPPGVSLPDHAIFHETGYVLPKASGDLLVGTTQEEAGFDRVPTNEARDDIMERVARIAPRVVDAPIRDLTACLRPYSTDEKPIIGAVPGGDGLYLATGHAFKGVTLALTTGRNLAQLMVEGRSDFALDEFSPSRLKARG